MKQYVKGTCSHVKLAFNFETICQGTFDLFEGFTPKREALCHHKT